jgi:hypothetical protein
VRARGRQALPEHQLDALLGQRARRVSGQVRRELALEHAPAAVHEDHPRLPRRDRAVGARGRPHEVVQRRRHLRAREAAAGDHEREHRAAQVGIVHRRALLEHVDDVVADAHRVGERLERQRVLGQAGDATEVGHVPQREHQVIEPQLVRLRGQPRAKGDHAPLEIHRLDLAHEQLRARQQLAQRADGVEDAHVAGDHLRQHRLEHEVVLAVDQ